MIRTLDSKLVLRPDGQGEFYDLKERSYAAEEDVLRARMPDW